MPNVNYPVNIYLENMQYLTNPATGKGCNFVLDKSSIIGEPVIDYFMAAPGKRIVDDYFVGINGVHFLEFDENTSAALTNNSTTEIAIGDKTQNRSITLDYTAYRNGKIEQGQVLIFHDGTTLYINKTSHDNQSGNGIGLSIDTKFDTTNTDLINIELVVNDNVDAVTFDYSITRKQL